MKKNIFVSLSALFCLLLCVACGTTETPEEVALQTTQLFEKGEYEAYVNSFQGLDADKKAQAIELYETKGKAIIEQKGAVTGSKVGKTTLNEAGDTASVVVYVYYTDGDSIDIDYKLFKQDGKWVVNGLE